jgi:hypothetical protein
VTFDLAEAKYSISGEYNKCLLHLWSADRNVVRRILDAEVRNGNLRLMGRGWASPVRRDSKSAATAIGAHLPAGEQHVPPIYSVCAACWSASSLLLPS